MSPEPKASKDRAPKSGGRKVGTQKDKAPTAAEARAEFEADRAANKAAKRAQMDAAFGDGVPGRAIVVLSWICTAVFTLVTVPAIIDPDRFVGLFFVVSVVLFFAGCALFVVDIVLAAARSRDDLMGIGGLFFLIGSAPRSAQANLLGSMAVQLVVAVAGAAAHPFTPLAFGTLVPMIGLAFCGLWTVRHGNFPPQPPEAPPARPPRAAGRTTPAKPSPAGAASATPPPSAP
ncbi:hypothetical protein BH10ACT3_BH10ACT3_22600 [soil metagenome]